MRLRNLRVAGSWTFIMLEKAARSSGGRDRATAWRVQMRRTAKGQRISFQMRPPRLDIWLMCSPIPRRISQIDSTTFQSTRMAEGWSPREPATLLQCTSEFYLWKDTCARRRQPQRYLQQVNIPCTTAYRPYRVLGV